VKNKEKVTQKKTKYWAAAFTHTMHLAFIDLVVCGGGGSFRFLFLV